MSPNRILLLVLVTFVAPFAAAQPAPRVYWGDNTADEIWQANLDGTDPVALVTTMVGNPSSLHVDLAGENLYWSDSTIGAILRADLVTGVPEVLQTVGQPFALALDRAGQRVYWIDRATDRFQSCNLDGSDFQSDLAPISGSSPQAGVFDSVNGYYYWTDWSADTIQRIRPDGSGIEAIVSGLSQPAGIGIDPVGGKVYWADRNPGVIERANLDGTDVETVLITPNPLGLAVDGAGGRIYYGDSTLDELRTATLLGAEDQLLFSGTTSPLSVALSIEVGSAPIDAFLRGDANSDGGVDVSDAVFVLAGLFIPGADPGSCLDAVDTNDDGLADVSDAVFLLASLFLPGAPPLPEPASCAPDPTADALDCADFPACP